VVRARDLRQLAHQDNGKLRSKVDTELGSFHVRRGVAACFKRGSACLGVKSSARTERATGAYKRAQVGLSWSGKNERDTEIEVGDINQEAGRTRCDAQASDHHSPDDHLKVGNVTLFS